MENELLIPDNCLHPIRIDGLYDPIKQNSQVMVAINRYENARNYYNHAKKSGIKEIYDYAKSIYDKVCEQIKTILASENLNQFNRERLNKLCGAAL